MSALECLLLLMPAQEHSWGIMSAYKHSWAASRATIISHEHSWAIMSAHKHSWAVSRATIISHEHSWGWCCSDKSTSDHHDNILMSAHEGFWVLNSKQKSDDKNDKNKNWIFSEQTWKGLLKNIQDRISRPQLNFNCCQVWHENDFAQHLCFSLQEPFF